MLCIIRKRTADKEVERRRHRRKQNDTNETEPRTGGDDAASDIDDDDDIVKASDDGDGVGRGIERLAVTEDVESTNATTTPAAESLVTTFTDGVFTVTIAGPQSNPSASATPGTICSEQTAECFVPCPRMNPLMCVQRGTLFLYGGVVEDGDRQITLSDFYSLDLHRMDEWKTIIPLDTSTQVINRSGLVVSRSCSLNLIISGCSEVI